jgi:hypothetical protein
MHRERYHERESHASEVPVIVWHGPEKKTRDDLMDTIVE